MTALTACALRPPNGYQVLPAQPEYLLRAPDLTRTPFPEVPATYTRTGSGWADLTAGMQLRLEVAYFRTPSTGNDLADYLGTETVRYDVTSRGRLAQTGDLDLLPERPRGQASVNQLLSAQQRALPLHRYFYQFLLAPTDTSRKAVLLSAASTAGLLTLENRLRSGSMDLCDNNSRNCTIFPEHSSASLEMEILVNGSKRVVSWGTRLGRVVDGKHWPRLYRQYRGASKRVEIPPNDAGALALPLLPGDHIKW